MMRTALGIALVAIVVGIAFAAGFIVGISHMRGTSNGASATSLLRAQSGKDGETRGQTAGELSALVDAMDRVVVAGEKLSANLDRGISLAEFSDRLGSFDDAIVQFRSDIGKLNLRDFPFASGEPSKAPTFLGQVQVASTELQRAREAWYDAIKYAAEEDHYARTQPDVAKHISKPLREQNEAARDASIRRAMEAVGSARTLIEELRSRVGPQTP